MLLHTQTTIPKLLTDNANGLVAGVNSANNSGVLMQFFTAKPDQKWHTHAA